MQPSLIAALKHQGVMLDREWKDLKTEEAREIIRRVDNYNYSR
jgi:hypothetical protein